MEKEFASFAETLADRAGEIARAYFRMPFEVMQKPDDSPVTIADREIEKTLAELIREQFPRHGIVGEEFGAHNPGAEFQWVIDPIDGTTAFIAGIPTFTTLIALCKNDVPILGVIDQPVLCERWSSTLLASQQQPATRSGFLLATTSTDYFSAEEDQSFERVRANASATIRHGDAYLYGKLASGHIHAVMDASLKPYDFCALVPVVTAAGGVISDWSGVPLTLRSKGEVLACASKELHADIIKLLKA
jgi:histidinol phosphatase-like enzyme (inositol monophosphatase family)